ncbi:MAG: DUF1178 family protein [Desulfobacterales bacterium]|nr:DUF1178 family protein [Desulfobacterales bacterium]MBF0396570.1 DUF1178 family protein [Desulfobacterales bacterium]
MIAFDLECSNGHVFECWFKDGQSYDEQREKGFIECPVCNDKSVSKIPSSFSIARSFPFEKQPKPKQENLQVDIEALGKKIYNFIEKNFDDVGCNFAKEALKIHYGVTEPRHIRGVSTDAEEEMLKSEGIKFFKVSIPQKPDTSET